MEVEECRATIKHLQGEIKALSGRSEQEAEEILHNDRRIDAARRSAVIYFQQQGFTDRRSKGWIIDELYDLEDVRLFWLSELEQTAPASDSRRKEQRDQIIVRLAESTYVSAQCRTEFVARSQRSWREIYRALLLEEIARLQWEIARGRRS